MVSQRTLDDLLILLALFERQEDELRADYAAQLAAIDEQIAAAQTTLALLTRPDA